MLNSTASFIDRIKSFVFQKSHILVSFDVVSLFTNIPLKETIDMVCDYVYESDSKPPFERKTFKKLLEIATGGYFLYKDTLYCQVDGVTMGSPLGPTLANFFLAHFETKFMTNKPSFAPDLYLRYVDDLFCVFQSHASLLRFLEFLNGLHQNLKFTYELGPDQLAFLDTYIRLPTDSDVVSSTVYRKPSNTNVILNYSAICPQAWKLGLITCFINRAYTVCSTWKLFDGEIERLKSIFSSNGYPLQFFEKCLNSFLTKKLSMNTNRIVSVDQEFIPIICLPYTGYPSINFRKRLTSIFRSAGVNVKVIFRSFRVKNCFSLKSRTPVGLRAKVVYKFQCSCDKNMSYIGKTKRHLTIRSTEHRTQRSAVSDHLKECRTCEDFYGLDNFSVLASAQNDYELRIKEALFIKRQIPTLNKQLAQHGSAFFLRIF